MKCKVLCNNEAKIRGLCNKHYVAACILIKKGKTDWSDLIKRGLADEKKPNRVKSKETVEYEKMFDESTLT